jgi:hypothetical protein
MDSRGRLSSTAFEAQTLPPPKPYGFGKQELSVISGGSWTAYDSAFEAGIRFGDVVGRIDTVAIGSSGPDRGAAIASTWRGWPVAVTAHAFTLPDDHGIELRAEHEYFAPRFTTYLAAGGSSRGFGTAAITFRQRKSKEFIRATGDSDHHWRATAGLNADLGDLEMTLTGEAGEHLTVGGFTSSVVPDSLRVERVDDPALPRGFVVTDRYRSARATIGTDMVFLFWRRYDFGDHVDVRGLEASISAPALGLLKSAGFDLTLGGAKVTGIRGLKGWIGLRWRP